jgi:hypothetical protein
MTPAACRAFREEMRNDMQIGSEEHKQLFCRSFIETHRPYEPREMPWPALDDVSLARLRAIPIWSMALDVEVSAGFMLNGFARTESDPLVRQALEVQGFEEDRHGRILAEMASRYGLPIKQAEPTKQATRQAFVDFGYDECVDSFAGFGIFRLARDARILPESLTSLFVRVLEEEARHIVFFINWIAWDRERRGCRGPVMQAIPALLCYGHAVARRIKGGAEMAGGGNRNSSDPLDLFADVMKGLTPAKFVRSCIEENDRYMRGFDPRLLRPRVIPTLARAALFVLETIDLVRSTTNRGEAPAS